MLFQTCCPEDEVKIKSLWLKYYNPVSQSSSLKVKIKQSHFLVSGEWDYTMTSSRSSVNREVFMHSDIVKQLNDSDSEIRVWGTWSP